MIKQLTVLSFLVLAAFCSLSSNILISAATVPQTTGVRGFGNSALLDGATGYITANNSTSGNASLGYTVESWFKMNIPAGSAIDKSMTLVNKLDANSESYLLNTNVMSNDGVHYLMSYFFVVNDGGLGCHTDISQSGHRNLTYNEATAWQHLAGVIQDDGTLGIFINGKQDLFSSGSVSGTCNSTGPVRVGSTAFGSHQGFFDGQIDELRISKVARYQNDFTPLYSPVPTDANTVLFYRFDNQNGTTVVTDISGNGRSGQVAGGVQFIRSTIPTPADSSKI